MKRLHNRINISISVTILILALFLCAAIFAEKIAPHGYKGVNLADSLVPPFFQGGKPHYVLGTDLQGRDILSRIIYGARVSLIVTTAAILLSGAFGTMLGIIAGYKGGWVDTFISRAVDVMMGFPVILLAMVMAIVFGASMFNLVFIMALILWVRFARQVRGETLIIREMDYVTLARLAGCSDWTIMVRHILPNVINSVIVLATLLVGYAIMLEASLSFLGVGVPPPTPSWGSMVAQGREIVVSAWWVSFFPGFTIMLVVLSGNLFGDWLRDKLDPKLRDL